MDVILHQLSALVLKALPTFVLVLLLFAYLKQVFFKPMKKVLHERYEVTEGARKGAEESLRRAAAKTAEFEAAMRAARSEVYKEQEQLHKQLQERGAADLAAARQAADSAVKTAREQLAKEVEIARANLQHESEALANEIAETILRRSAA